MEILYLRIFSTGTEYKLSFVDKDINFSPQHQFYYDQGIKYAFNNTYIDDLYGDNIKVTGLIGSNGVGKTTLLGFLQFLIAKLEGLESTHRYPYENWEWLTIINKNGLYIADENTYSNLEDLEPFELAGLAIGPEATPTLATSLLYSPHFDLKEPNFDTPDYINVSSDFILYHESNTKEDRDENVSQMINFRRNEIKRQIAFMQYAEQNDNVQFYQAFNRKTISISFEHNIKKLDSDPRYITYEDYEIYKQIDTLFLSYSRDLNFRLRRKKSGTDAELATLWFYKRLFEVIYVNIENRGDENIGTEYRMPLTESFSLKEEDSVIENIRQFFINQLLVDATKLGLLLVKVGTIFDSVLLYEENDRSFSCPLETAKELMTIETEILSLLPYSSKLPLFVMDWEGMSTGEKAYLNLFSRIHYGLNQLNMHPKIQDATKIYFLIDEPSTGFHPQWQKEYLRNLLLFLDVRYEGEKHLIISSHSPFLVSDLQKEDVVPLSMNSLKHSFLENTFGANIQDLLADNFFLQGGFIGDFAKKKIDDLINLLTTTENVSQESLEDAQKLINIIGEPLIRDRLQEMFDARFKTEREIEREIERLQSLLKTKQDEKN